MDNQKFLILDGISGATIGKDIQACIENSSYCDLAGLGNIPLYKARSSWAKLKRKQANKDSFYHLPKKQYRQLASIISKVKPDVVLVIGFIYRFIAPEQLKKLSQQHAIKLYLYDTDSCNLYSERREFMYFIETEMQIYERIFSFSRVVTDFLTRLKLDAVFAPFGANLLENINRGKFEHDVFFVGSADLRRIFMLEHIAEKVTVRGARWSKNCGLISSKLNSRVSDKPLWDEELRQHLLGSKIVLNITRGPFYAAETGVNLRIFEAMALGCFVLTDYCDEIAELFELGVEIETFKGSEELVQKVAYYLENDEARLAIAKRGYQKILSHYTWKHRVNDMLANM